MNSKETHPLRERVVGATFPREGDIPYWTSPPIQYVYTKTAPLAAGAYTWVDQPGDMTPVRPVRNTLLYYFRDITLYADIEEADFSAALDVTPQFRPSLRGSGNRAVLFREPILMPRFLQNFGYRLFWETNQTPERLLGSFRGTLTQTPALIGKTSITLTAIISAQEIKDRNYVDQFKKMYPLVGGR